MSEDEGPSSRIEVDPNESKHQFNTYVRRSVLELLRAASFHEDESISSIVERAVVDELERMQAERGEQYEIYPPHRIEKDSK
jgi:hypothetical protein